jgi:S1-C subfamily serine protease
VRQAIVGVLARIPSTARTAAVLGTTRQGTGVLIDAEGHIVTIGYVILEADAVEIYDHQGRRLPALPVGYDATSGFGLLRAAVPIDAAPLRMGRSATLQPQDPVLVVRFGFEDAIAPAVVASRRTFAGYWEYLLDGAIFTVPALDDFAGAALLDQNYELVGIGSLLVGDAVGDRSGVPGNMFVPIDKFSAVLAELKATGREGGPPRPWLGLILREQFDQVLIAQVAVGGPAQSAGIVAGDILLALEDKPIVDLADFYRRLWQLGQAGVAVELTVLRDSAPLRITVHSGDRYDFYRQPTLR